MSLSHEFEPLLGHNVTSEGEAARLLTDVGVGNGEAEAVGDGLGVIGGGVSTPDPVVGTAGTDDPPLLHATASSIVDTAKTIAMYLM